MIETLYVYPSWAHAHDRVDYDVAMEIFSSPGYLCCLMEIPYFLLSKTNLKAVVHLKVRE